MANPAAVYCGELGYQYKIVGTDEGQYGACVFPDGSECDEWAFLAGKCGQGYSYCAKQGYDLIVKADGRNPFSKEYGVCVHDQQEIGPVTELMGLREKATTGTSPVEQRQSPSEEGAPVDRGLPSSFDWRNYTGQDWMTSVKNQGNCGSCWAFSAVGVVEARYNIRNHDPNFDLDLSEEYLVSDCYTHPSYSMNCCGGANDISFQFIRDSGIPDEGCMPYADLSCTCPSTCSSANCTYYTGNQCSNRTCSDRCSDWQSRLRKISQTGYVANDRPTIKQYVVDLGPLGASLYMGGAFDGDNIYRCTTTPGLNHDVVIAGYDDAGGYWIVKNSWGASWGPDGNGYFKVGYGQCLIETLVSYADVPAVAVGGIAQLPDVASDSGSRTGTYAALAGGLAAALLFLTASAWYARRRWAR